MFFRGPGRVFFTRISLSDVEFMGRRVFDIKIIKGEKNYKNYRQFIERGSYLERKRTNEDYGKKKKIIRIKYK